MRLERIRIQNFRSFRDERIVLGNHNCLVGPNDSGKSTVLMALNVFFRNNAATQTDVLHLSEEDFHHKNTREPVVITLTFTDLSSEAQEDFKAYYRQKELTISAKARWDAREQAATVQQCGQRMVMEEFAPFFRADEQRARVAELRKVYQDIKAEFPKLPDASTKTAMTQALHSYEESHPERCKLVESTHQFYGWSKGENRLGRHVQWVYVPAVKDATSEEQEGTRTALGQLLQRTIRAKVDFSEKLTELKGQLEEEYKEIIGQQQEILGDIQTSIEARLRDWTTESSSLSLTWDYDRDKSLVVSEPFARVRIGQDEFVAEVARAGHGMQRAFLIALLQELALSDTETGPTLLLGIEEPELYQHPPQARHMASLLEALTKSNTQIILSTHSPYFVSAERFEQVRMVRKNPEGKYTTVSQASYAEMVRRIADALGEEPRAPSALMASVAQIMQPSQRELFFCNAPILVEGIEDVAYIATHLKLTEQWDIFRAKGGHLVVAQGKTNMSRLAAISLCLAIPCFCVFDCDSEAQGGGGRARNARDNSCILNLCGKTDVDDPLPASNISGPRYMAWSTNIRKAVREDVGPDTWDRAEQAAMTENDWTEGLRNSSKNALVVAATLDVLNRDGTRSGLLTNLCERILAFLEGAPPL